ncbi:MAG: site-specific integrase [Anaerolineales bacterium]|jgi:integrase
MANKRRSNKEGHFHQRKNGSWRVQLYYQGRRLSFSAKSKKECQDWLGETLELTKAGISIQGLTIKTSEFLTLWLNNKQGSISDKVHSQYAQVTRDYIVPNIGQLKLRKITPLHIIKLLKKELRNKRKQIVGWRTKRLIHTILHQAFKNANVWGLLMKNPTYGVSPPKKQIKEMQVLSPSEASHLLVTAHLLEDPLYPLVKIALNSGMRLSELRAIQWGDIDWQNKTIRVDKQIKRKSGGGFKFAPPKTEASQRTIELGESTLDTLKQHREKQFENMLLAGDQWQDNNLVFTTSRGTPLQSTKLRKRFYKLLDKAGLQRIRFHDLRHTAASFMLNSNVPVLSVSKRLGHSSVSTTLDTYGHLIPEMQKGIGNLLDDLITPTSVKIAPKLHQNVG